MTTTKWRPIVGTSDAAQCLGGSSTVRRMIELGQLDAALKGDRYIVSRESVTALLEQDVGRESAERIVAEVIEAPAA